MYFISPLLKFKVQWLVLSRIVCVRLNNISNTLSIIVYKFHFSLPWLHEDLFKCFPIKCLVCFSSLGYLNRQVTYVCNFKFSTFSISHCVYNDKFCLHHKCKRWFSPLSIVHVWQFVVTISQYIIGWALSIVKFDWPH